MKELIFLLLIIPVLIVLVGNLRNDAGSGHFFICLSRSNSIIGYHLINPLDLLKLNTKIQIFFCCLNENLMTFLYTFIGGDKKTEGEKKFSF